MSKRTAQTVKKVKVTNNRVKHKTVQVLTAVVVVETKAMIAMMIHQILFSLVTGAYKNGNFNLRKIQRTMKNSYSNEYDD